MRVCEGGGDRVRTRAAIMFGFGLRMLFGFGVQDEGGGMASIVMASE